MVDWPGPMIRSDDEARHANAIADTAGALASRRPHQPPATREVTIPAGFPNPEDDTGGSGLHDRSAVPGAPQLLRSPAPVKPSDAVGRVASPPPVVRVNNPLTVSRHSQDGLR